MDSVVTTTPTEARSPLIGMNHAQPSALRMMTILPPALPGGRGTLSKWA